MTFFVNLISKIKKLFSGYFPAHKEDDLTLDRFPEEPTNIGVSGAIDADILVLRDDDRMILSIDYDFKDILGWVEWDVNDNRIDLVQKSGSVAALGSVIPAADVEDFRNLNKVFVITRYNQDKIMHNLSLIIRE